MKVLIEALHKEAAALVADSQQGGPLLDAYLYQTHIRCGKSSCRCMNSEYRHSLWCLSYATDGKSHTRTVPKEAVPEVRALCEHYRQLRSHRKQVLSLTEKVVAAMDQHVKQHAADGWQRFEQLKARLRSGEAKTANGTRKGARQP